MAFGTVRGEDGGDVTGEVDGGARLRGNSRFQVRIPRNVPLARQRSKRTDLPWKLILDPSLEFERWSLETPIAFMRASS